MSIALTLELMEARRDDAPWLLETCKRQAERIAQLESENQALRAESEARLETIRKQNQQITEFEEKLEQAQREAKRQAAPFRRPEEKREKNPQKPGRPEGHPGAYRRAPELVDVHEEVPLERCPHCGSTAFKQQTKLVQHVLEIPEPKPIVIELVTYQARCAQCDAELESDHPLKVSSATGAAGTHLGPRALAIAAELHQHHGLPVRKTCAILENLFGLSITPGGLAQALQRVAAKLKPQYDALAEELRNAPAAYIDETSWWIGQPAWLWVIATAHLTYYVAADSRGREVLHQVLPSDYPGVLVSDCLATYDNATLHQHKCYSHHLQAISEAAQRHPHPDPGYLQELRDLLHAAMALKDFKPAIDQSSFEKSCRRLEARADLLLGLPRAEPAEEAVRQRLFKQRDHLFTFLYHDAVDATNNLAERQLRPAVIARKISCGNRTRAGANAFEILTSLAATCDQRRTSFIDLVTQGLRHGPQSSKPPPPSPPTLRN